MCVADGEIGSRVAPGGPVSFGVGRSTSIASVGPKVPSPHQQPDSKRPTRSYQARTWESVVFSSQTVLFLIRFGDLCRTTELDGLCRTPGVGISVCNVRIVDVGSKNLSENQRKAKKVV